MKDNLGVNPRLEYHLAIELSELLGQVPTGAELSVPPSSDLCSSLELFVPQLLRCRYTEWLEESLDGIFVAHAQKTATHAVRLLGTCILISDQTVTPFLIDLELSPSATSVKSFRVLLGEPGGGALGISGPACNSKDARRLLETLTGRLGDIEWVYEVASDTGC